MGMLARVLIVALIILALLAMLIGCGPSGPSHSEAKNAIWDDVQLRASRGDHRYKDVEDIEIVHIGEKVESERLPGVLPWYVRLYLIKPGSRVKCEAGLTKKGSGEWYVILLYDAKSW